MTYRRKHLRLYSFWKLQTVSTKTKQQRLTPIGKIGTVIKKLTSIPHVKNSVSSPYDVCNLPIIKMVWTIDTGVILRVRPECSQNSDVYEINAISTVSDQNFYRLYVILWDMFGVTLFADYSHSFLTLKEYKSKVLKQ